jgi:hypothetical protein
MAEGLEAGGRRVLLEKSLSGCVAMFNSMNQGSRMVNFLLPQHHTC